jgi:hypothetical protein
MQTTLPEPTRRGRKSGRKSGFVDAIRSGRYSANPGNQLLILRGFHFLSSQARLPSRGTFAQRFAWLFGHSLIGYLELSKQLTAQIRP